MTPADLRIHISLGDPTGVGPEIVVRTLAEPSAPPVVVHGHGAVLRAAARLLSLPDPVTTGRAVLVEPAGDVDPFEEPGLAQWQYLESAARAAAAGEVDALVTAPVSKKSLRAAGFPFPGHTEFLADRAGRPEVAMCFVGPRLRVLLATIHEPLRNVPESLTAQRLTSVLVTGARGLARDLGLPAPRVLVAGLNPHAGESGILGEEEERVMRPAMDAAAALLADQGIRATFLGPLPGDSVFRLALEGAGDAVCAAYHDQGLIPVKLLDWNETVNVTLGLPFVRTSPAHGTAPDIAWKGCADPSGFRAALRLGAEMAQNRRTTVDN